MNDNNTNSNRPPMSPLGRSLFDMMNAMNAVAHHARTVQEIDHKNKLLGLMKPETAFKIKRASEGKI